MKYRKKIPIFVISMVLSLTAGFAQQRSLNFYIAKAISNSPLLHKNGNDDKIIHLDLEQVRSVLSRPEINIEANVMFAPIISHDNNKNRLEWVSEGATNYSGYDLSASDGGQYQAVISVKQPLFNATKLKAFSTKTDVLHRQNENIRVLTVHEIEQLVGYQYILCLKSKMQIDNNSSLLIEIKSQLPIMQKLAESAIYKQTDLMLLQIEIQNYEFDYNQSLADYKNNLYDLNLLCGVDDTLMVDLEPLDLQIKAPISESSKFLTSFQLDSLSVASEQVINELKYRPQLTIFANAGLNAVYLPTINRLGFSTGINFSWTLFDGNQRKLQREKSIISLQTIEFQKNNFAVQYSLSKAKLLNQIVTLEGQITLLQDQLNQYGKLLILFDKELSQGEVSVMDYKNFLKDFTTKHQKYLLLKMERQMLVNSYNYWNY